MSANVEPVNHSLSGHIRAERCNKVNLEVREIRMLYACVSLVFKAINDGYSRMPPYDIDYCNLDTAPLNLEKDLSSM
jgi:hypothetical protein